MELLIGLVKMRTSVIGIITEKVKNIDSTFKGRESMGEGASIIGFPRWLFTRR